MCSVKNLPAWCETAQLVKALVTKANALSLVLRASMVKELTHTGCALTSTQALVTSSQELRIHTCAIKSDSIPMFARHSPELFLITDHHV